MALALLRHHHHLLAERSKRQEVLMHCSHQMESTTSLSAKRSAARRMTVLEARPLFDAKASSRSLRAADQHRHTRTLTAQASPSIPPRSIAPSSLTRTLSRTRARFLCRVTTSRLAARHTQIQVLLFQIVVSPWHVRILRKMARPEDTVELMSRQ